MKNSTPSSSADTSKSSDQPGMENLSENEKKALELKEHAEHETGQKREHIQKEAVKKAG